MGTASFSRSPFGLRAVFPRSCACVLCCEVNGSKFSFSASLSAFPGVLCSLSSSLALAGHSIYSVHNTDDSSAAEERRRRRRSMLKVFGTESQTGGELHSAQLVKCYKIEGRLVFSTRRGRGVI
ncbi:unnamed protein product [Calypogeia fissa]